MNTSPTDSPAPSDAPRSGSGVDVKLPAAAFCGPIIRKNDDTPGGATLEAQGLRWLAEAMDDGGAVVVPVRIGEGWIEEPRLPSAPLTPEAARAFGRALAVTHAAGAPAFGAAPPGWDGRTQMGRSNIRLRPHAVEPSGPPPRPWGQFYAEDRLVPYIGPGRDNGALSRSDAALLERVCSRIADGLYDADQPALVCERARERGARVAVARTHGDLWCGNIVWTTAAAVGAWAPSRAGLGCGAESARLVESAESDGPRGWGGAGTEDRGASAAGGTVGVLIDPLAQGAHAETDLAALRVFGQPLVEKIVAGYSETSALADGWRERIGVHQLHMLMIHVFLFGGGYGMEAVNVARAYA